MKTSNLWRCSSKSHNQFRRNLIYFTDIYFDLWNNDSIIQHWELANCIQMTTTKRQRKMSYRSSVTVNFVCATKFCFDPPFFNGSSPRALSASIPRITHRARANWLVSTPILSSALFILNFCVVFIISEMISFKNILLIKIWAIHNFHINTFFKNKHFVKIRNFQTMQLHLLIPPHSGPSLVYPVLNSLVNQHDFNTEHC